MRRNLGRSAAGVDEAFVSVVVGALPRGMVYVFIGIYALRLGGVFFLLLTSLAKRIRHSVAR